MSTTTMSGDPAAPERRGLSREATLALARLRRIQVDAGIEVLRILGASAPSHDPESIYWGPCERCGHLWAARSFRYPRLCPACRSAYWDRARLRAPNTAPERTERAEKSEDDVARRHRMLRTDDAPTPASSLKLPPPPGPRPPMGSSLSMDDVFPPQPERAVAGTASQASLSAQLAERLAAELGEVKAEAPADNASPEPESKSELEPENENEEPPPAA